jgi:protein disulfide-isomerase A1
MGVFGDSESAAAKLYLSVASGDENNVYKITTAAAVKSKLGITADTVVVIKQYDEGRNDLNVEGATDGAAISSFINGNVVPLINVYTREKAAKIFSSPVKVHGLFFTDADEDSHKTVTEEVRSIAGNHKGEVLFVNIPGSESGILEYFGMKKTDLPAFILADMGGGGSMKKYPYTGAMKGEQISAHITAFTSGKLKPSLKSEEPTAADLEGDVAVLKGKSFNEVVMDNTKDVLVEFYAPWCGHCKKLAPIYDELGAKLADNDNVVIAKMDSTANEIDVEGVNVSGFPTLYWFKGNDKANPVLYQGGRDLESFLAYIKENAHNEVSHEEL